MTTAYAHRSIRALAATAIAVVGLVGLGACSAGDSGTPDASNSNPKPTSTASLESEPKSEPESGEEKKCSEEQVATISAPTSVTIPSEDVAEATPDFTGAALIAGLPVVCVISFVDADASGSYAVLSGGAASLAVVSANIKESGGEVTDVDGSFQASLDGLTLYGIDFEEFTPETAGFENTDDLVLIATNSVDG